MRRPRKPSLAVSLLLILPGLAIALLFILPGLPGPTPGSQGRSGAESAQGVWSVSLTPILSIGAVEGPDEYLLFAARDATQLSDGTIVVGMFLRNSFELRYYDPQGVFLRSVGRFGDGPFELRSGFVSLERLDDSVLVIGVRDPRYSLWGPAGEPVRSDHLSVPMPSMPAGLLDDKHLGTRGVGTGSVEFGKISDPPLVPFYVVNLETETSSRVATVRSNRTALAPDGLFLSLPFEPTAFYAAGGGYFWIGNSRESTIKGYAPGLNTPAEIVLDWPRRSISGEDQQSWKDYDLAPWEEHDLEGESAKIQREIRAHHRGLKFPEEAPFYQALHVDRAGRIWVLQYAPPWSTEDYQWSVYGADGTRLAMATIPFALLDRSIRKDGTGSVDRLLEIGEDYVLVQHFDDLGVLFVKKYRLEKEG